MLCFFYLTLYHRGKAAAATRMKFLRNILIIILLALTTSIINAEQNFESQKEFNQIIDEIVRYRLNTVAIVQEETIPINNHLPEDTGFINEKDAPKTPANGMIEYSQDFFSTLIINNILTNSEAEYMYTSMDSALVVSIDSTLVSKPTLTKSEIDSLFDYDIDYAYQYFEKTYGTSCFMRVSTPLFNQDRTKLLLSIDYFCGPLYGRGYVFILNKKDDKWMIVEELGTWESKRTTTWNLLP